MQADASWEARAGQLVFNLRGKFGLEETAQLREQMWRALNDHRPSLLVLNLSELNTLDVTLVSWLITVRNWVGKMKGRMILAGLTEKQRVFLEQYRLDLYFEHAATTEQALVVETNGAAAYRRPAEKMR